MNKFSDYSYHTADHKEVKPYDLWCTKINPEQIFKWGAMNDIHISAKMELV